MTTPFQVDVDVELDPLMRGEEVEAKEGAHAHTSTLPSALPDSLVVVNGEQRRATTSWMRTGW